MRVIHRIRVEGTTAAADRLRVLLHKAGFLLVPDSSAAVTIELSDGDRLSLDSVDSPLEARIEANLEELDRRFACGAYLKQRAGGNRDPARAVLTVPAGLAEGVALAILRAVVQVSDQAVQPHTFGSLGPTPSTKRPWWRFWTS